MTQTSAPKIALNGLGRMGKLALRDLFDRGLGENIVLINDLAGDAEQQGGVDENRSCMLMFSLSGSPWELL